MNKTFLYIGGAIVVLIVGFFLLNSFIYNEKQGETGFQEGHEDIAYTINGRVVDLENGTATLGGSTFSMEGDETEGDLSEDGISDIAFMLKEEKATSTAYYLVAAIRTDGGYRGTGGALIGENIEPQGIQWLSGGVVTRYYREEESAMATSTATSTQSRRQLERFFVVIDGELQSTTMPE